MARAMARKRRAQQKSNSTIWIIGGIVAAVVLVAALVLINSNTTHPTGAPSPINAGRVLGHPDAPVTIDEYADFQCPICARAEGVIRQLVPDYIDTGKVKIVFHNFPFIGAESLAAAQAAECANDQGKFWDYAGYLFDHQSGENVGAFSQANLEQFATDLNLDSTTFNACLDSGKYASLVQQELSEGSSRGVNATPSFFINGQFVQGLLSLDQFKATIDSLLPKS